MVGVYKEVIIQFGRGVYWCCIIISDNNKNVLIN